MSTKNVTLKEKVNGALGDTIFPATTTPNVYDSAKSQALSQTLVNTPDYEALGFAKFSTATAYNAGDKVYKDNEIYRFIADKTAGEWDVAKVEPWSIEQEIEEVDDAIRSLIPAQASADNKLADKAYVNDKVSTDTATFRGTFNLVTDLELTTEATQGQIATALGTAISGEDKNDYAFVQIPTSDATPTEIARIDRYKYTGLLWAFEYSLNNSGFTAEQWAAINSGITSSLVTAFGAKYDKPAGGIPVSDMNTSTFDDEPTENSVKPAKSGGIWSWVTGLINGVKTWASGIFARIDGWYSTLVAGAAENLVGHGTTPAEYTFRTSGGNADIGTGTATIDVLKGKTLKWNQLIQNGDFVNGVQSFGSRYNNTISASNGICTLSGNAEGIYPTIYQVVSFELNHKYYIACDVLSATKLFKIALAKNTFAKNVQVAFDPSASPYRAKTIMTNNASDSVWLDLDFAKDSAEPSNDELKFTNLVCIDLTQMFGAGNEPTTPEEFEALYPLSYYDYTATPVLINNKASGIVTTGFNQWDGTFSETNGYLTNENSKTANNNYNISSYIRVFGNTDYYIKDIIPSSEVNPALCWYDINKNFISGLRNGGGTNNIYNKVLTSPSNAAYLRCSINKANTLIACINLSWSGYRNGEYEPYEEHTLYFDTINQASGGLHTIKGQKLVDGVPDGNSVTIFPEGMKSVGDVYDFGKVDSDGYIRKVTNRIGSRAYASGDESDATVITDGSTTTYYVLDTPEEYLLDTPIPANYIVNDFGTEQRIPVDTASSVMAPILYDVKYAMNAVDTIRRLPQNYISSESMTQFLAALGTAMNGTWSMSWNSENERYNFSFTPTETQGE